MVTVAGILFCLAIVHVFADDCGGEKFKELGNGVIMRCRKGVWKVSKRSQPKGPPCSDDPSLSANGTCSADRGHCQQYTAAGADMDRDCPETCESCDACRCQDASQWHAYCPYWSQYCGSSGVLGTWMTSNCRKTCGKCTCKCCSYWGKQHQLGARIPLPEKCGELVCEEGLVADYSPLIKGAAGHKVSHPEELTLNFRSVHNGADCCILPGNARSAGGSSFPNGTMVQEGWSGDLVTRKGELPTICCHGVLSVPLEDARIRSVTATTTATTPTTTTAYYSPGDPQCSRSYTTLSQDWRRIEYGVKHNTMYCDKKGSTSHHTQFVSGWYRFSFREAVYAKIPTTAPLGQYTQDDRQGCGTYAVTWISDDMPSVGQPPKDVTINWAYRANPTFWTSKAKIVACTDGKKTFYLYNLPPTHRCYIGYCAM